jgi:hypothetical protein
MAETVSISLVRLAAAGGAVAPGISITMIISAAASVVITAAAAAAGQILTTRLAVLARAA